MSHPEPRPCQATPDEEAAHKDGRQQRGWFSLHTWKAWGRLVRVWLRGWSTDRLIAAVLVSIVFAVSLWVIAYELKGFEYAEVWAYLRDLPVAYVAVAVGLTGLTFVVLAGYDALALRYINVELASRRIAFSAFIGYAVSQAVGNPILTGGSVRYRLYSIWGLTPGQVAKAILFAGVSFWLGFCTLGAVVFLFEPIALKQTSNLPVSPVVLGVLSLLPLLAYVGVAALRTEPLTVWGWTLEVPPLWMVPVQVALASGDLFLASSVVYVLLPPDVGISLMYLVSVYLIALLGGLVSHVPGGLGVFEGIMLLLLTPHIRPPVVLGGLLAYRGIFHLMPLALAMLAFGVYELRRSLQHFTD